MPKLYTLGHSNHSIQEFLEILRAHKITDLIDVRTLPGSKRMPWFNKEALQKTLAKAKIKYQHMPELGGLRKPKSDSVNKGWRNSAFKGYADYMQTPEFFAALKKLKGALKPNKRVAVMCAEAVPWRCHRSLIADALVVRKIKVLHITGKSKPREHQMTSFALVKRDKRPIQIWYP